MPQTAERHPQQHENSCDDDGHNDGQSAHGALLVLELPAILDRVAGRQFHLLRDALLDVRHDSAQIPAAHVALHNPASLILLAIDLDGANHLSNLGQLGYGNGAACLGLHQDVADGFRVGTIRLLISEVDAEPAGEQIDLVDHFAAHRKLDHFEDPADTHAVAGAGFAIGDHLDLRLPKTLLDGEIHQARDVVDRIADLGRFHPQDLEILSVEFDGKLGLDPGEQLVERILDGLGEVELHAGERLERSLQRDDELLFVLEAVPCIQRLQLDVDLGVVHGMGMTTGFGSANSRDDLVHLRELHDATFHLHHRLRPLLQRDRGRHGDTDENGPLLKRGNELRAKVGDDEQAGHEGNHSQDDNEDLDAQRRPQQRSVHSLEATDQKQLAMTPPTQQKQRQHGGDHDGREHRAQKREGNRERHGGKHFSLDAFQHENGQEHADNDADGEDDGATHFPGCVVDHQRLVLAFAVRLSQVPVDVLHHHDGAVSQHPDGDGDAAQGHQVGRDSLPAHAQHGHQRADRQRYGHDERRAPVPQKNQQCDQD